MVDGGGEPQDAAAGGRRRRREDAKLDKEGQAGKEGRTGSRDYPSMTPAPHQRGGPKSIPQMVSCVIMTATSEGGYKNQKILQTSFIDAPYTRAYAV